MSWRARRVPARWRERPAHRRTAREHGSGGCPFIFQHHSAASIFVVSSGACGGVVSAPSVPAARAGTPSPPVLAGSQLLLRRHQRGGHGRARADTDRALDDAQRPCYVFCTMKLHTLFLFAALAAVTINLGCKSFLPNTAAATSLPVTSGQATTNDSQVVAVLKEAQAINTAANPTPYEPIVNDALGGLIALAGAFGGWYARHVTATAQIAAALATPVPTATPTKT